MTKTIYLNPKIQEWHKQELKKLEEIKKKN